MNFHYGQQPWLLEVLEADNKLYIEDIPCDLMVWLEPPKVKIPERRGKLERIQQNCKLVKEMLLPWEYASWRSNSLT